MKSFQPVFPIAAASTSSPSSPSSRRNISNCLKSSPVFIALRLIKNRRFYLSRLIRRIDPRVNECPFLLLLLLLPPPPAPCVRARLIDHRLEFREFHVIRIVRLSVCFFSVTLLDINQVSVIWYYSQGHKSERM